MQLETKAIFFVALVVALVLHELAHGVAALWFGDDTPRRARRLNLDLSSHLDPFGSLIIPALGALAGAPVIGWAKPMPVTPSRMRDPRRDPLFVTLAGPAANLVLMAVSAAVARSLSGPASGAIFISDLSFPVQVALTFAVVNLFLGVFHFVPIPPLDGAALVERWLPRHRRDGWQRFEPYGIALIFGLLFFTSVPGNLFSPFLRRLYGYVLR